MVELASSEGLPAIAERITAHIEGLQGELLPQGPRRILDPICEQNQAEPNARISRFNRLEYALPERYDGSREIPDAEIETYGATVLGAQSGRGAADLIAAAHRAGPFGTPGRDSELKFARTAQGIADAYGFYDPDPDDPTQRPRRLYVKLIVHLRDLRGPRGEELLAAYAEIDCDGIIAAIAGFHDDAIDEEILEGASWLFELRRRAEKPVFSSAPGELGLPLVQHGLDGVHVPVDARPRVPWPHRSSNAVRLKRCFHPDLLGELVDQPLGAGQSHAHALFAELGCGCARHPPLELPPAGLVRTEHTLVSRAKLAALSDSALERRLARAEELVIDHRLGEINLAGWELVAEAARATRRADEERRTG